MTTLARLTNRANLKDSEDYASIVAPTSLKYMKVISTMEKGKDTEEASIFSMVKKVMKDCGDMT